MTSVRRSRVREGRPYPLGATWDGRGVNFALFSANATKVELCLFDHFGDKESGAHRASGIHRRGVARLPARCPARHDLRLPRARPLRAERRPSVQPQQAGARPLRQGDRRAPEMEPGAVRLQDGDRATTPTFDERDSAPSCRSARVIDPPSPGASDRRLRRPWDQDRHLRDARARLHQASSARAGEAARHVSRPDPAGGDQAHQVARRHRRRAAAHPHLRQRRLPARTRA